MGRPRLLIRADAAPHIGIGHWMRCSALAEEWCRDGEAAWISRHAAPALLDRLRAMGVVHKAIPETASLEQELSLVRGAASGADWTVLDGYHFDAEYQTATGAQRLLVIDDFANLPLYHADVVLNQNLSADTLSYRLASDTATLLLGPRYALLRPEFHRLEAKPVSARATRVLATFGGSDPADMTSRAVAALAGLPAMTGRVVIGPANLNPLRKLPANVTAFRSPERMSELMLWADLAVAAAGTVTLELCATGLPMILIVAADNQVALAARLHDEGVALNLGWAESVTVERLREEIERLSADHARRERMSAAGRALVDGRGVERVVRTMRGLP